jgi:ribosomal protein S7
MKYNSIENTNSKKVLIKKFETRLLKEGKQTKARLILVNIFNHFKNLNENPFFIIEKEISNFKPFFYYKNSSKR